VIRALAAAALSIGLLAATLWATIWLVLKLIQGAYS
jgi:hypothetical protein